MRTLAVFICGPFALLLMGAGAQTPATPSDAQYLLIEGKTTSGWVSGVNLSKVGERLAEAGGRGYAFHSMARSRWSINILLKRDGEGSRSYRLVHDTSEDRFLKELNAAGSEGFGVVADTIKVYNEGKYRTEWVAVMARHSDAARFEYSMAKGAEEAGRALADSTAAGRVLKAIVGLEGAIHAKTLLFFEKTEPPAAASAGNDGREYRIVSTARTSTMQANLAEAAAERFRMIGAGSGFMTAVMARDPGATAEPVEYQLIAMIRVATAVKELNEGGAKGFRMAAMSENGGEVVFILQRAPRTEQRFEYTILELEEATADRALRDAETEGYRIAYLVNTFVVLQRPAA